MLGKVARNQFERVVIRSAAEGECVEILPTQVPRFDGGARPAGDAVLENHGEGQDIASATARRLFEEPEYEAPFAGAARDAIPDLIS